MVKHADAEMDWLLWVLLSHTRDTLLRAIMKDLRSFDVYPMEVGLLFVLHKSQTPDPTPADISRWMFRESQTISALLKRMERRGLIKKVKNKKRKKGVRVVPTAKGTEIYAKTIKLEYMARIVSSLSDKERQQLRNYLEQLRKAGLRELDMEDTVLFPIEEKV